MSLLKGIFLRCCMDGKKIQLVSNHLSRSIFCSPKKGIRPLGGLFLLLLLLGCQPEKETGELLMIISHDSIEEAPLAIMAAQYEEETKQRMTVKTVSSHDFPLEIKHRLLRKDIPAMAKSAQFSKVNEKLLDLSETIDRNRIEEDFLLPAILNKKLIAVPVHTTVKGMFYNKKIFRELGIAIPAREDRRWTWPDFEGRVLLPIKQGGYIPLLWDPTFSQYSVLLYQFGAAQFNADFSQIILNQAPAIEALSYFVQLFRKEYIFPPNWMGEHNLAHLFKAGEVAVHFSGSERMADYQKNISEFEWGVLPMPQLRERATVTETQFLYSFKDSGMEEESQAFIQWLYRPENYRKLLQLGYYFPTIKGFSIDYSAVAEKSDVFLDERNSRSFFSRNDRIRERKFPGKDPQDTVMIQITRALKGEISPEEAMQYIAQIYSELFGLPVKEKP